MGIKIVAETDDDYELWDWEHPHFPLALARSHLDAAIEAAQRWGSNPADAFLFLANELEDRRKLASVAAPPALPGTVKQPIPRSLAKQIFERDAYRCVHCGTWIDLSVDHIIPESQGARSDARCV